MQNFKESRMREICTYGLTRGRGNKSPSLLYRLGVVALISYRKDIEVIGNRMRKRTRFFFLHHQDFSIWLPDPGFIGHIEEKSCFDNARHRHDAAFFNFWFL